MTPPGKAVILTGMPRSGISVVAEALFEAGLFLGDRLDLGSSRLIAGLFGDKDVARFHGSLLEDRGMTWASGAPGPVIAGEQHRRGVRLLESKYKDRRVWGWKDPATVLFLDYWNEVLPEARWVFVYRHPAQVAWSLLLEDLLKQQSDHPFWQAFRGLRLWAHYNRRILAFVRRHPDRSLLLQSPRTFGAAEGSRFDEVIRERWSCDLRAIALEDVFRPHFLCRRTPRWLANLTRADRSALRLFRDLTELEDELWKKQLGSTPAPSRGRSRPALAASARPVVAIVARFRGEYSQTFVRDHVHRLPASVRFVYGARSFLRTQDGLPLLSVPERGIDALIQGFGARSRRLENRAFRRFLRNEKVDCVLAEFGPTGTALMRACRAANVPLVVHFHGYDAFRASSLERYREEYEAMFATAGAFVVVSREMELQLVRLGAPREKVFNVPCGVDTAAFAGARPDACPPTFLCVGRLVDKKGPLLSLLAFERVVRACPDARLIVIGDGDLFEASRQLARALGLEPFVDFWGAQPSPVVRETMRRVRAFVQHSVTSSDGNAEGTPVAVLEAAASGLPVVSTTHAGIPDAVIHDETGFLVDEGDVDQMASCMIALARDPALAAELGARGQRHVAAHFAVESQIQKLYDVIERAIRGGHPSRTQ